MIALLAFVLPALAVAPPPFSTAWLLSAPTAAEVDAAVVSATESATTEEVLAITTDLSGTVSNIFSHLDLADMDMATRTRWENAWRIAESALSALLRAGMTLDVIIFISPGNNWLGPNGFYYDAPSTAGNGGGSSSGGDGTADSDDEDDDGDDGNNCDWDHDPETGDPEWDDPVGIFAENEPWLLEPSATLSVLAIEGDTVWLGTMRLADVAAVIGWAP